MLHLYVAQSDPDLDPDLEEFCWGSLSVDIDDSQGSCEEGDCRDIGTIEVICRDRVEEGETDGSADGASSDSTVP